LLILKPGKFIVFGVIFMSTLHSLSHLPLSFETNVGETDPSVNFLVRGSGFTLFLTPREMVLVLTQSPTHPERDRTFPRSPDSLSPSEPTVLRLKFNGANPAAGAEGVAALPGTANYFSGNDPSRWYTDIPTFSKVRYRDLYPGIDIVYYGTQGKLEYDLIVAPGADPGMITLEFEGDGRLDRNEVGDLEFQTSQGNIAFPRPQIYQEIDQVRRRIDGRYIINDANRIGFTLADYDRNYPLVIDPELAYSTYLGGANNDRGRGIVLDSAGNAYITGYTYSSDFPTLNPLQPINHGYTEVFVTKIKADGSALLFSTYLGGADWDEAYGIALDSVGNAYITGFTYSTDFPTLNPLQPTNHGFYDAFVTKMKVDGSALLFATYLGGAGSDIANGIALDSAGNAYITGYTNSTDFPTLNPLQSTNHGYDAFVIKMKADGLALLFSTYLGGSGWDVANGIVVDSAGNAYITGYSNSTDFSTLNPLQPTNHGSYDAFVTKITFQVSLTVTKSAASNPVFAGDNLSYTLQVTNAGPDSATGVTLTDSLPATVNLISVQTSQGSYSQAGNTLTFQLGTLTAGASATISVVVVPTSPGAITNRAVLSSAETEPEEVSLDTAVLSSVPVLNVTMVSVPDLVRVGAVLTYSIALINQGPGVITGLSLVDILPSGMEFIAIHASQSDPPDSEEPVTYNLDLLPGGEAALVEIVVIPRISGAFTNTVSVTGNQIAAQTFSVTTTVLPALFDSGLYQIAVGKIREFVPTGSFKQDLLQLMVEVEKLRRQGRFPEAHNLTILVIQKIIRYRSRRRGQQLGLNLAVIDLRLFDQSL
jgi:uncharacterized repeat protein (TIGR01451 family)